jgi:Mrp family chromosome partitioning ATPase
VVLLVSRIAVTPRSGLHRASELLQFGEGHLTGIVVNDVRVAEHYYGYGYGYGKGKYNGYYSEEGDRHEPVMKPEREQRFAVTKKDE